MRKSLEELHTMAMLMGGWYDPIDHTVCLHDMAGDLWCVDPDTLERLDHRLEWSSRTKRVANGEIGHFDDELWRIHNAIGNSI